MFTRVIQITGAVLILLAGSFGAAERADATGVCPPGLELRNLAVVNGWIEGLLGGTPDVERFWSPAATLTLPDSLPYGGTYTRDEFPAYTFALLQFWQLAPGGGEPRLLAACDRVFLLGRWTATSVVTGQFVDQPLVEEFVVRRGQIVSDTLYFFDTDELVTALGL